MNYIMFPKGLEKIAMGTVQLGTDTIKMATVKDTYSYDAADEYIDPAMVSDIPSAAGARQTITLSESLNSDVVEISMSTSIVEFPLITGTIKYLVIYQAGSDDTDSPVLGLIDFESDTKTCSNSKLTATFSGHLMEVFS